MNDLISRQAAISHVDDVPYIKEHPNVGLLWKAWIESLPSAQPEPHWILCSEMLPAYGDDVLISIGGYCDVGHIVSVNEEEQYNWYFSGWYHLPNDVDAWMPLPEPYQEGKQDE